MSAGVHCTPLRKDAAAFPGSGQPAALHRKVTTCARVQGLSGLNVVALVPAVMPQVTAQSIAACAQSPCAGISVNCPPGQKQVNSGWTPFSKRKQPSAFSAAR